MTSTKLREGGHYIDMKTFASEEEAVRYMKTINQARRKAGNNNIVVLVPGPDDGEFTVMELQEAIDGNFGYSWEM
jgi:hypothetical protein